MLTTILFLFAVIGFCSIVFIALFFKELFKKEEISAAKNIISPVFACGFTKNEMKAFKAEGE